MTNITEKTFAGMANGTYKLTETDAPDGYIITSGDIYFKVSDGTVKLTDENGNEAAYTNASLADDNTTIVVKNTAGAALPSTGGSGTRMIYLFGAILAALAGAGIVMWKSRRNVA